MIRQTIAALLGMIGVAGAADNVGAMDERAFWSLIESSRQNAESNQDKQFKQLKKLLSRLSRDNLVSYYQIYQDHKDRAYHQDLWAAAYIINGGCSDDCFDYFRAWLIAQGEAVYTAALKDPESLVGKAVPYQTEFEELNYAAVDVFGQKFGGDIPFTPTTVTLQGEDWDEGSVDSKYPKLAAWIASQ